MKVMLRKFGCRSSYIHHNQLRHHHQQAQQDVDQVKDVRVPEQLQRAMAAEAEAAREARAKVLLLMLLLMIMLMAEG